MIWDKPVWFYVTPTLIKMRKAYEDVLDSRNTSSLSIKIAKKKILEIKIELDNRNIAL